MEPAFPFHVSLALSATHDAEVQDLQNGIASPLAQTKTISACSLDITSTDTEDNVEHPTDESGVDDCCEDCDWGCDGCALDFLADVGCCVVVGLWLAMNSREGDSASTPVPFALA